MLAGKRRIAIATGLLLGHAADLMIGCVIHSRLSIALHRQPMGRREVGVTKIILASG
jgi:hypothetical protein